VALLAAPRAGLVPLLLDSRLPADRTAALLARVGAVGVCGEGEDVGVPMVSPAGPFRAWPVEVDPTAVHSVVFTSGTTGAPKGVRITWGNLEASAAASARHLAHSPADRWLGVLPVSHVGGLGILIRSLRQRSTVILEPSFDVHRAASLLDGNATLASLVTATLRQLIDTGRRFTGVRAVLVGGGPVPGSIVTEARAAGLPALATYGMTETASQVATASLADPDPEWLEPLAGVDISVADGGRIAVSGPMVSPGYLDEPDRVGPFVSSDRGEMAAGRIRVLGRSGEVFVSGGENVDPFEVEEILRSIPGVGEAVVTGLPDEVWGAVVAAAIEIGPRTTLGEVAALARSRLAPFQFPRLWVVSDTLPRLTTGKVDRMAALEVLASSDGQSM
jgi:O-succinylbenzoic acid--CoA ligase